MIGESNGRWSVGAFWQVTGWGIGVLVSMGGALMFAPIYAGRLLACFLFALSGLWGAVAIFVWGRGMTTWTRQRRLNLAAAVAADVILTAGLIWFALPMAQAQAPPSAVPRVTITGGNNVVSVGQIGGITAREVTINNPPVRPQFRILGKTDVTNPDGTHTVTITGTVASPITPGLLFLQIHAAGMRNASVMAAPVDGVSMTGLRNVRRLPGLYSAEIPSPHGNYIITVVTVGTPDVKLSASF